MIELKNNVIGVYTDLPFSDFKIYVMDNGEDYECYLQKDNCGIITLMYGMKKSDISLKDFIDSISYNVESYELDYNLDYED